MNKNRHRIIFNAARGQRMVVAESASSGGGSSSGETSASGSGSASLGDLDIYPSNRLSNVALHPLALSIGLVLTLGLVFHTSAHAQIVAADGAVQITAAGIDNTQGHLASIQSTLGIDSGAHALVNSHLRIEMPKAS